MTNLAVVSKMTKQGLSIWRFIQTDDGCFFAFGGCKPACKAFASLAELRSCFRSWINYGYEPGLVPTKPVHKTAFLSDPWSSDLPVHIQKELEELSV